MGEKGEKVLSGPWKGTPISPEEVDSTDLEMQANTLQGFQAKVIPVAPCAEFLRIVATARREDILQGKISQEVQHYGRWSLEQLLRFVNNPKNHSILIQKPVLVLALHDLIQKRRR